MEQFSQVTEICGHKIFDILKIDGVKFFFDKKDNNSSSWILMRESGTEPLLRFYIETGSKENLEKIKEFIKTKLLLYRSYICLKIRTFRLQPFDFIFIFP